MKKNSLKKEIKEFIDLLNEYKDSQTNNSFSKEKQDYHNLVPQKYGKLEKYIIELSDEPEVTLKDSKNGEKVNPYHNIPTRRPTDTVKFINIVVRDLNSILGKLKGMTAEYFQELFSNSKEKVIEKEVEEIVEKKGFFYYSNPLYWFYFIVKYIWNFKKHKTLSIIAGLIGAIILGLIINYFYAILEPYLPFLPTKK